VSNPLKQIVLVFVVIAASGFCDPIADSLNALRSGQIEMAELYRLEISNPAAKLFVEACIERSKGDAKSALRTAAKLVALYPNDSDWTGKAEIMVAALYVEVGRLDAAGVAVRQIQLLYEGSDIAAKAATLGEQIELLKKEAELKGSVE
jgi:hypothetical protein